MIENIVEKLGYSASHNQIAVIVNAIKDEALLTKSLIDEFRVIEIIKETLNVD